MRVVRRQVASQHQEVVPQIQRDGRYGFSVVRVDPLGCENGIPGQPVSEVAREVLGGTW